MVKINIFTEGTVRLPYKTADRRFIKSITGKLLLLKQVENVSINIIMTDNESIRAVNESYRGKNYSTDVISFAYREVPFPGTDSCLEELGDIYISLEKAFEQSVEYGVTFNDELKRLMVHGVLHLLGYDHERSEDDERIMETEEESILKSL